MRTRMLLVAATIATAAVGCSSDSEADPPPTSAEVVTTPPVDPTTTERTTTTTSSTTSTSSTTLPPTTVSPEEVEAEIAAAYLGLQEKALGLVTDPRLEGLELRAAEVAISGSPYFNILVQRVTDLVNNDQYLKLNDPNLRSITVESVELLDGPASGRAFITTCQVGNALLIKRAESSPVPGSSIPVGGTGELSAARFTLDIEKTADGWRLNGVADPGDPVWPGASECPKA